MKDAGIMILIKHATILMLKIMYYIWENNIEIP